LGQHGHHHVVAVHRAFLCPFLVVAKVAGVLQQFGRRVGQPVPIKGNGCRPYLPQCIQFICWIERGVVDLATTAANPRASLSLWVGRDKRELPPARVAGANSPVG